MIGMVGFVAGLVVTFCMYYGLTDVFRKGATIRDRINGFIIGLLALANLGLAAFIVLNLVPAMQALLK